MVHRRTVPTVRSRTTIPGGVDDDHDTPCDAATGAHRAPRRPGRLRADPAPARNAPPAGPLRGRLHGERADLRQRRRDQRRRRDQAAVHLRARSRRQPRGQPRARARLPVDVRAVRRRAPTAAQAAGAAVPRTPAGRLRADRRRGDRPRIRELAGRQSFRNAALDDADHAQRDPPRGLRRRRGRVRRAARTAPAVRHPRLPAGRAADPETRPLQPLAPLRTDAAAVRRDRRPADRRRPARTATTSWRCCCRPATTTVPG